MQKPSGKNLFKINKNKKKTQKSGGSMYKIKDIKLKKKKKTRQINRCVGECMLHL